MKTCFKIRQWWFLFWFSRKQRYSSSFLHPLFWSVPRFYKNEKQQQKVICYSLATEMNNWRTISNWIFQLAVLFRKIWSFFLSFFFSPEPESTWKFPDQGWNLSCSCHLHCSCGWGILNLLLLAGNQTHASRATQVAAVESYHHCTTARTPWNLNSKIHTYISKKIVLYSLQF